MTLIFNQQWSLERRRELRKKMTSAELYVWMRLSRQQILGITFRRQHNIGKYIADFYAPRLKLAVEIDGKTHSTPEAQAYDAVRDAFFASLGIITLRFTNEAVFDDLNGVADTIHRTCESMLATAPATPRNSRARTSPS